MKTKDGMVVRNVNSTCTQSCAHQHADPCVVVLISLMIWMHECAHIPKPAHRQVAHERPRVDGGNLLVWLPSGKPKLDLGAVCPWGESPDRSSELTQASGGADADSGSS